MPSKQFDGYFIYTLIDPRDNVVRYIGITKNMGRRLNEHIDHPSNHRKQAWFAELKQQGLSARMEILEVIDPGPDALYTAKEREEYWIQEYLRVSTPLFNVRGVIKAYPKPKRRLFIDQATLLLSCTGLQNQQGGLLTYPTSRERLFSRLTSHHLMTSKTYSKTCRQL